MIATISIPGGANFCFKRFALRGKALDDAVAKWRAEWLEENGESQETLSAVRSGLELSDAAAFEVRYRDGSRVFGGDEVVL